MDRKGVEDYSDKNMSVRMSLAGHIQANFASGDLIMGRQLAEYAHCTHTMTVTIAVGFSLLSAAWSLK